MEFLILDPETDAITKLEHVQDMLQRLQHRGIFSQTVLRDNWYATNAIKKYLPKEQKTFYCPIKSNRKVDDSFGQAPYKPVDELQWQQEELAQGKLVKLHQFPLDVKVKLFWIAVSTHRTDYFVTNDVEQNDIEADKQISSLRWCVE